MWFACPIGEVYVCVEGNDIDININIHMYAGGGGNDWGLNWDGHGFVGMNLAGWDG